jgi:hypothetical protein
MTIALPAHWEPTLAGVVLAPRGDRLAYLLTRTQTPPQSPLLRRLWQWFGKGVRQERSIWVSDLEGHHMREIGYSIVRPGAPIPDDLRWTPDGKQLSFIAGKSLYTVPAD